MKKNEKIIVVVAFVLIGALVTWLTIAEAKRMKAAKKVEEEVAKDLVTGTPKPE